MTNPNDPIVPVGKAWEAGAGYTKREDMAVKFMASMLIADHLKSYDDLAIYAVMSADALIKRLNQDDK